MAEPPQFNGVEHRWLDAGGLNVHLAEAGEPNGDPVLLLHGWPEHWYLWREVIGPLAAAGYRVLAPDLRGFGWTEAPGEGYDGPTFARDQVALLDALGIDAAFVLGHDWGGWTTFLLGLDHPERVRAMVACNAPHPWPRLRPALLPGAWRGWYGAFAALAPRTRPVSWVARWILTHGHAGDDPLSPEDLDLFLAQFGEPARAKATSALYTYYFRVFAQGLRQEFASRRLTVPTLQLFGEGDIYVNSKLVRRPEDWQPHADEMQVELIPDSGHFIVDEKPELVTERALAHFGAERGSDGAA